MSHLNAPGPAPQVQHSFDGDARVLNATFDRRMEIRKALQALTQDLENTEGHPIQIAAEIKLRVGGTSAQQHTYNITVTGNNFDAAEFARGVSSRDDKAAKVAGGKGPSSSPGVQLNGQQGTPRQSSSRPESRRADGDDEVVEIRPFKRSRADGNKSAGALVPESPSPQEQTTGSSIDDVHAFLKRWHEEWVRQGGWLFDNITSANKSTETAKTTLDKKLDGVQDVIGQSLNTANAGTMAELANISKLIPWLEHCRKTSADKVQAREEKWRSSSATFHDQTRRDREAAEERIEKKLKEQRELLLKLAKANGVSVDDTEEGADGPRRESREESLGAQLTAELNMEASKSGSSSRGDAEHDTIYIEDDN